jgi:serine/threonine-protein kinase
MLQPSSVTPPCGIDATDADRLRVKTPVSPGELIGGYRLILELATGGMASIHAALAEHGKCANRFAAVKLLHPHLVEEPTYRAMFLDEANIASQIRHPNVCSVFDYGECDGIPFIAMEYLLGEPTSAIWSALPRGGGARERRRRAVLVTRIVSDVAEALHAAHEARSAEGLPLYVVHRDVSPENLVVTYDGRVKLCDFGIAIAEHQEHQTEAGMLKGKYAYIQPEVLRGQRPDRRSDIFSLGIVLWELLTGERLFRRESTVETLQAVAETLVPAPSAVVEDLPPALDGAVLRALSSDPGERFASAREFGIALTAALANSGENASLGGVSEWMSELFPGQRARKEELVERAAEHSGPLRRTVSIPDLPTPDIDSEAPTLAIGWDNNERGRSALQNDDSAAPTLAIEWGNERSRSTLPPRFRAEPAQVPRSRRTAIAFALGATLGATLFASQLPTADTGAPKTNTASLVPAPGASDNGSRGPGMSCETDFATSFSDAARPAQYADMSAATQIEASNHKREKSHRHADRIETTFPDFRPLDNQIQVVHALELRSAPHGSSPVHLTWSELLNGSTKKATDLADAARHHARTGLVSSIAGERSSEPDTSQVWTQRARSLPR